MTTRAVLAFSLLPALWGGCAVVEPYADYTGGSALPRPLEASIALYRTGKPEPPIQDLGVVHVTCPHKTTRGGEVHGGCTYAQAIELARRHVLRAGGDGLYNIRIEPLPAAGRYASLDAVVFRRTGAPIFKAAPPPPVTDAELPSVEERLRRLEKMRDDGQITPEDYERRKAVIIKDV